MILVRVDPRRVAYITIQNESKLNALGSALMDELSEAFEELAKDDSLRAAVVTGAGAEGLLRRREHPGDGGARPRHSSRFHHAPASLLRCSADLPVPVIARIQGYALGAGWNWELACDLRIAADTARLGMPEVKLGIPSVIEAALLPPLVGWGRARQILYLGETFTAADAAAWGLVELVVETLGARRRRREMGLFHPEGRSSSHPPAEEATPPVGRFAAARSDQRRHRLFRIGLGNGGASAHYETISIVMSLVTVLKIMLVFDQPMEAQPPVECPFCFDRMQIEDRDGILWVVCPNGCPTEFERPVVLHARAVAS